LIGAKEIKMKKIGTLVVCLALGLVAAACSSGGDESSPNAEHGAEQSGLVVTGGDATQRLGISSWRLGTDGVIDGLAKDGKLVAQFKAHGDKAAIESVVPLAGLKVLEPGGSDTFSADTREIYDALIKDMKALKPPSDESSSAGDNLGKVQQKVWYGPAACCYVNYSANYYWWVDGGGYTPYCHVDVFTNLSCSGYTSCFDYGYSTGCNYWI
jgi:hypothetical protein